jgi:hypothetical protein
MEAIRRLMNTTFTTYPTLAAYQEEYQINFAESGLNYVPIAVS